MISGHSLCAKFFLILVHAFWRRATTGRRKAKVGKVIEESGLFPWTIKSIERYVSDCLYKLIIEIRSEEFDLSREVCLLNL